MTAPPQSGDRARTDAFRHDPRAARGLVAIVMLLLLLALAGVLVGPGYDPASSDPLWAALVIGCLAVPLAGLLWAMRRRPVLLRVGPDGIDLPVGFARPLAWADIHRIRQLPETRRLIGTHRWLIVDPLPGVLPRYRLPGPRRLERWLMPRWGIRIPLHTLDAAPEDIVASIERYRPVLSAGRGSA